MSAVLPYGRQSVSDEDIAAVAQVLRETLQRMDPRWPAPDFDVEEQRTRLLKEEPVA